MENDTTRDALAPSTIDAVAGWLTSSAGLSILLTLGTLGIAVMAWTFWVRLTRLNQLEAARARTQGDAAPPPDRAAQRRMAGMAFTLDRIGGGRRKAAKRALMGGQTQLAKGVFQAARQDNPLERLRGLALIAEQEGDADTAADYYAEMYATEHTRFGPRHPQTRQGAVLYAAFLREQRPQDPALAALEATYGPRIGT